jgi:lipopolysaccharide transport system permease protein
MQSITDFKQNFDLVFSMTKATMKSRYRKTAAGFLWVILNPILTFAVQALIFKNILKVNVENYYLFLLSGIIPWIFLTSTISMTVSSFVMNRPVLMAFKLDPRIFVFAQTIDNFITFIISFVVLLLLNGQLSVLYGLKLPMFVMALILMCLSTFLISCLLATLHVFMRDTQFIVQFALNLFYFITPIFYPVDLIPEKYQWAIRLNPLYMLIKPFQSIFWKYDPDLFLVDYTKALGLLVALAILTVIYWQRKKDVLYFRI